MGDHRVACAQDHLGAGRTPAVFSRRGEGVDLAGLHHHAARYGLLRCAIHAETLDEAAAGRVKPRLGPERQGLVAQPPDPVGEVDASHGNLSVGGPEAIRLFIFTRTPSFCNLRSVCT